MIWLRRTIRVFIVLVLIALVYQADAIWSTYRHEMAVAGHVPPKHSTVVVLYCGPEWIPVSFRVWLRMFNRVVHISMWSDHYAFWEKPDPQPLSKELFDEVRTLTRLKSTTIQWEPESEEQLQWLDGIPITSLSIRGITLSQAALERLVSGRNLDHLKLFHIDFVDSDAALLQLSRLTQLEELDLTLTNLTDHDLVHLANLKRLTMLCLGKTFISDEGLAHLGPMTTLTHLDLRHTNITDVSIPTLKPFDQLGYLDVSYTQLSESGVDELRRALPNCKIIWDVATLR